RVDVAPLLRSCASVRILTNRPPRLLRGLLPSTFHHSTFKFGSGENETSPYRMPDSFSCPVCGECISAGSRSWPTRAYGDPNQAPCRDLPGECLFRSLLWHLSDGAEQSGRNPISCVRAHAKEHQYAADAARCEPSLLPACG